MRLVWDIETNGFLEHTTTIHCIAIKDADTQESWSYGPNEITEGVAKLMAASELIGHNIISFDIHALSKVIPSFTIEGIKVTDTLVLSRLMRSDLKNDDFTRGWTNEDFPRKYHGSHSLKAWGMRLGVLKGDFGETSDWSEWTQEMQDYCVQDTEVTYALWKHLAPEAYSQKAIEFEHDIAWICDEIGKTGWTFDIEKAGTLYGQLSSERLTLENELQTLFPSWVIETEFIPKVNNKSRGYVKGEPFIKQKEVQFNPNSRKHIEKCLRDKYDWKPKVFTPSGDAKIDETTLGELAYPEAQKLARSFMLQKRIGQLAEGNNAWLKLVGNDGKLRHTINPIGTVTGRASSFGPNLQQVVSTRAEYGTECRQLFGVPEGYKLVGADLSGIELRVLADMLPDGGKYAEEILKGDIHQANADMAGISRSEAKTMIYALCYGSGDARLGAILGKGAKEGRALRERFYAANPAFATLVRQVKEAAKRGYLYGLDRRKIPVRSDHAALNTLIQGASAIVAKKWVQLVHEELKKQDFQSSIIAFVHDEVQIQTKGDADYVGNHIAVRMAREAGKQLGFKIPIEAEYSVGTNWAECH